MSVQTTPSRWSPAPSKGIGAAIAKALAADGWAVAVNYRSDADGADAPSRRSRSAGGTAKAIHADVTNGDAKALLKQVEDELGGPVLALVNNAGVARDNIAIQLTDEDWDVVIGTNLSAGVPAHARFGCDR